ncbi:transcriptional regulator [Mycobacterium malmoense]|uniref:Transcriptional regulator n=1 Tax=Mycobacterium malmoense TaxID=1780 RepID=A0A1B9D629_MYCMA|nr:TetR/AcrR family transcriptional regulator [Mycobacterium malmoense]OCB19426.1 transcriptional regulator [Mycobacterium malmoense]OCB30843.1 transcriptional regulator [Mycobacterium malmoense]OCB34664.1 transcriptional regulator [Mycobacterium malmoense]OCB50644.1 transcriptional regulator [Mycobacterium malmoense]
MRTHGWRGEPPTSDEDAAARIVAAADRCVRRRGGQTTIADVAAELGVSRKTVYRYFPSTTALLRAAATEGTRRFLKTMAERLKTIDDVAEAVVEGVVLTVTEVPNEPYLRLLLEEPSHALLRSVTSETARRIGQQVLVEHTSVDWERTPVASQALDELVEWALRAVHSFMSNPSDPPRDADELRGYLRRWLAPAIREWAARPATASVG